MYFCCVYLGNSFEMKVEAVSNDITECPCDNKPSIGTLCFYRASAVAASPVLATIGMSVRPSVCPSVRPSVCPSHADIV